MIYRKFFRTLLNAILLIVLVNSPMLLAQQLADGIAAIIGKEIVLKSEVDQMVRSYAVQNKINISKDPAALGRIQSEIFDRLIEQKVLLAKAVEDTITADDREVDQRVEQHIKYMKN